MSGCPINVGQERDVVAYANPSEVALKIGV